MALIAAGKDFSTLGMEGVNLAVCTTINTSVNPEYPAAPLLLGTKTIATDAGGYILCQTAGAYAIGTAGYISNDGTWTFTALTTANATASGDILGVMSQCASVTATPSTTLYDCVWVQVFGPVPGVRAWSGTAINVVLYSTTSAGVLNSASASGAVLITGIVTTTTATGGTVNVPGVMLYPQVALT